MDWIHRQGEGVADLANYAKDVWQTPSHAVGKYVDAAMAGLGVDSPETTAKFKQQLSDWQAKKEQDRAKVWGPGAFATDIAANPLTYAMGPQVSSAEMAPVVLPAGKEAMKEGLQLMSKAPGMGTKVAQGAVQGNVLSTLDPNANPISVGAGTVLGGAAPIAAEKVAVPLARGASNMVKGLWGHSATPTVEDVLPHYAAAFKGEHGDVFKADLQHNYSTDRAVYGAPFQALRGNEGGVELPKLEAGVDDLVTKLENNRGGRDEVVLGKIKALQAGLKNPDAPHDWGSALDVGSDLNSIMSDAQHGLVPNHNLARVVKPLKDLLDADMDVAGAANGQAYQKAKTGWAEHVIPWEDPKQGGKDLMQVLNNDKPYEAMRKLTMTGPTGAARLVEHSGPQGIRALQAGLADTAMKDAAHPVTGEMVPSRMLKSLNDREDIYNLVYKGADKARMDGYKKILGVSSLADNVLPGKYGVNASRIAEKLFSTEAGSDFLLGASHLNPKSRAFGEFVTANAPKILGAGSARLLSLHPRTTMGEGGEE
jgi:hypothetical protein